MSPVPTLVESTKHDIPTQKNARLFFVQSMKNILNEKKKHVNKSVTICPPRSWNVHTEKTF